MVPRISHHYIGGMERTGGGLTRHGSDGNDDWRSGWGSALVKEKGGVILFFGVAVIAVVVARAICDNGVP